MGDKKPAKTAEELYTDLLNRVRKITVKTQEQLELLRLDAIDPTLITALEKKEFEIYKKSVRASFRAEDAMQAVKDLNVGKAAERTSMLCNLGGLVVAAGLDKIDAEVFAGMLVGMKWAFDKAIADKDQAKMDGWKSKGVGLLTQRKSEADQRKAEKTEKKEEAAAKRKAAEVPTPTPAPEPSEVNDDSETLV